MINKKISLAAAVFAAGALASAWAGDKVDQGKNDSTQGQVQTEQNSVANVLIVDVPAGHSQQNDVLDLHSMCQARIIPVRLQTVPMGLNGEIQSEELADMADAQAANDAAIDLNYDAFTTTNVPARVNDIFVGAAPSPLSTMSISAIGWHFFLGIGGGMDRGYFGYGYRPYHGYGDRFDSRYSRYGYYDNGLIYTYNPGWYVRVDLGRNRFYYFR